MSVFVFLGPSLPVARARALLDAVYLPPVALGDVYTLTVSRARAGDYIAIIDGLFEQVPAVWHKEILFALSKGIHVYGAASMGALRACETESFGMRGVGRIFEAFRGLRLESDDEVVVAHGDAASGHRSLSTALVSIRFGVEAMVEAGSLLPSLGKMLISQAQKLHYSRRSWAGVLGDAAAAGEPAEVLAAIRAQARRPDAKAEDATALLTLLGSEARKQPTPYKPAFIFQTTSFWTGLTQSMAMRVEAARNRGSGNEEAMEGAAVAAFVRAGGKDREHLLEEALLDRLAVDFSRDFVPDRKEIREAMLRIARRHGLANQEALRNWRTQQELGEFEWQQALAIEARRFRLLRTFVGQLDTFLIARLKASGRFDTVRARRRTARTQIERYAMVKPQLADLGLNPEVLQAWYVERFGPLSPDPASHAQALGFATLRDFIDALLECYLADEQVSSAAQEGLLPEELENAGYGRK